MYCDNPHKSCPVVSCYSNIYVGKIADVSTTVTVHIENMATGRVQMEDVTSDADGVILLSGGTYRKFLTGYATYKLRIFKAGVQQDITMYTDIDTFDTDTFNAITFGTYQIRQSTGEMYAVSTQYLFKST